MIKKETGNTVILGKGQNETKLIEEGSHGTWGKEVAKGEITTQDGRREEKRSLKAF